VKGNAARSSKEIRIPLPEGLDPAKVVGHGGEIARELQREFGAEILGSERTLIVRGEATRVETAASLVSDLIVLAQADHTLTPGTVRDAIRMRRVDPHVSLPEALAGILLTTPSGKAIAPRTAGQRAYHGAMRGHDLVLAIGPAGTGKTYLAVAMAVVALRDRAVHRLILTRPAVEAGERLGFLPGDVAAKVDPYLRPLYDALYEMVGPDRFQRLSEKGIIEVVPIAFMRGRSLNDAFIILDEAQNTTHEQMKMFLTRIGFGSKAVVTGDVTQIDLPKDRPSGLVEAAEVLRNVPGVACVRLGQADVVRHELVQKIVRAYEQYETHGKPPASSG